MTKAFESLKSAEVAGRDRFVERVIAVGRTYGCVVMCTLAGYHVQPQLGGNGKVGKRWLCM